MSLISCIKKAGEYLDPQDKTSILNRARELRADGMTAKEAGKQAVAEVLELAQFELSAMEEGGIGDNILASVSDLPASSNKLFTFSPDAEAEPNDLIATHNLTAANVDFAMRVGGLAVPSIAITKKDNAIDGFGEITLIAGKEMVDPKGYAKTKVFGADIYSPRYPQVTFKLSPSALRQLNKTLEPYQDGSREIYGSDISSPRDLEQVEAFKKYASERGVERDVAAIALLQEVGADEKLFQGFTYSGNRRYAAHTLDNVVKELKKNLRGGESFNYGMGSVRANYTPQFKSVEQIKKNASRLVSTKEFEAIKKEMDDELLQVADDLKAYHPIGEKIGFLDTVTSVLVDMAKMPSARALSENGFREVPADARSGLLELASKLKNLPTEYFEAKILRGVDFAEFVAAVVPENASKQTVDALEKRGLKVYRYKDRDSRKQAILNAATQSNAVFSVSQPALPLANFRKLTGDYNASTAKADAEQILGIDSPVPILTKADVALAEIGVPMWYDLNTKEIYYNTAYKLHNRANDAQWMLEEIMHAIDHVSGASTMSLSSGRFNEGGDLRTEIEAAHKRSQVLKTQLDYPLIFTDLSDDRKAVELFARISVIFKGFPEALQVAAPKTYEVYRDIFSKLQSISSEVQQPSARDGGQEPDRLGARRDGSAFAGQSGAGQSADSKLERFRDAIVGSIQGERGGRAGDFGGLTLTSSQAQSTIEVDGKKRPRTNSNGQPIAQTDEALRNFWKWFGDSKAVDAQGKPLVVYHGTTKDFGEFAPGTGYFTADAFEANMYGGFNDSGANVVPAYLSIKNPRVIESETMTGTPRYVIADALMDVDIDGVVVTEGGKVRWAVVTEPTQIKSATGNNGNFDGSNPSILATVNTPTKRAARSLWFDETGRLQFAPGAAVNQWLADGIVGKALSRAMLRTASPAMRKQLRAMKLAVQDAQDKAVEVAKAAQAMSPQELAMVSDVIEQELSSGTVPPAEVLRMAAVMDAAMAQQTKELVSLGMLTAETAARWDGKYLPRYYGKSLGKTVESAWEKAARMLTRKPSALTGIKGKHLKGRGMYANASANEVQDWLDLGYEIRDADLDASIKTAADVQGLIKSGDLKPRDEVQVWRDFTRAERDDMGEIRDASLRFTLGYMETQRDIALGRMFEAMASDPELSSKTVTEKHTERVPDGTLEGSGAKRYGKLSGRYISRDDFSQLDNATGIESEMFKVYKEGLAKWKEGKTVLNPVAHFNNIVSNMSMAHFAGVSYWDTHKYIGALHDFATSAPKIKEARDAGLFLGTVSDEELRNMLPEELRKLVVQTESYGRKAGRFAFNVMALGLRKPLGAAYKAEDLFYRYLIWKDATNRGLDPEDAVDYAQKFIFDYSDLPKTARNIRDFGIPFFGYTYKFIPAFVSTALTHPTRIAAPAAVLWGLQAMAYGLLASGDEEDEGVLETIWQSVTDPVRRERAIELAKEEGQNLPKWMKGTTSIGTPRAIRLKNDESTGLPMFIDVSRFVPGGDIFDVHANAGGVPMLQWLTPNNPLLTTFGAMFLNRDSFTGRDVVDKDIDTDMEAAKKRSGWMWKQLTPAIAAGNYHWERTMQAAATANGGELPAWVPDLLGGDSTGVGKDGVAVTPGRAALNTIGIKIRPIDLDRSEQINESQKNGLIRKIDADVRSLQRQHKAGAISDRTLDKERDIAAEKKDRVRDGKDVDGNEKK